MSVVKHPSQDLFFLSGGSVSMVLYVDEDRRLLNLHWGAPLPVSALPFRGDEDRPVASFDLPLSAMPLDIPVCGNGWYGTPAVGIRNAQGDTVTDLRVVSWQISPGKTIPAGLPATYVETLAEADSLEFILQDALTGLRVIAQYTVFAGSGAVTRRLKLINEGPSPLQITHLFPASVPLWDHDYDVIHLKGAWARERSIVRFPCGAGEYRFGSQRGASGHEENPFIAVCDHTTSEFSGNVWALSFVYSGSFLAEVQTDIRNHTRLYIGMNPDVFSWQLDPGESFESPEAVMVFSPEGLNGMSQIFHRLFRERLARGPWRDCPRPVLINNWEGTYFDFTEDRLLAIAKEAASLGVELFVLDDGWFGRRNNDCSSLGDWTENREKLPHGLSGLSDRLHALGLRFGLWFEPEMVSPDSDLYRAHPDWCLHVKGRDRSQARNQLVLDLTRPEVQDTVIQAVSAVLSSTRIEYVKWDMNRNMTEAFSPSLPPERMNETQHRYMLGLYRVLDTITSRFPDILFESCSGGGGRFDPGMLFYMPQTWTSDDTDAMERLKIQYGTSLVYPVSSMGAHVSAVPNHQTGRIVSLATRAQVALSGNFGFEMDLTKMGPSELEEARHWVQIVRETRSLVQNGTFWRLSSPFEGTVTAWCYVSPGKDDALLCAFRTMFVPNSAPVRLRLKGLEATALYRLEDGRQFPGATLMNFGLFLPLKGDFSGTLLRLTKAEVPADR